MLQFNFFGREWIVEFENIRKKQQWKTKHNKTNEATNEQKPAPSQGMQ